MTVLFDNITNLARLSPGESLGFRTRSIRENDSGDGITATAGYTLWPDADSGDFTTPDLDAGPAVVVMGGESFDIVIPDSPTPVRLWPLIDAGMPTPPAGAPGFVRDGGGVARVQALTQAEYDTATHDPATLYVITD